MDKKKKQMCILCGVLSLGKDALRNKISIIICIVASLVCICADISNIVLVCVGAAAALLWHGRKWRIEWGFTLMRQSITDFEV